MNPDDISIYIHEAVAAALFLSWCAIIIALCSVLS
jgi:hypothetical protein